MNSGRPEALEGRSESKGKFKYPIERNGRSTVDDDGIVVGMAWVYIVRCTDGSLYVGHTDDVGTRELVHNMGHGSRFTAKRVPVRMVYSEECGSLKSASAASAS